MKTATVKKVSDRGYRINGTAYSVKSETDESGYTELYNVCQTGQGQQVRVILINLSTGEILDRRFLSKG